MAWSQRLAQHPGIYFGTGDGIESGPFISRIEIRVLPNGGTCIDDEATSREQGPQHREHSLLVCGPDGLDRLLIAHSESPYEMAVVIEQPDDDRITYAWWWATTGEAPVEQSRADARRT